MITMILEKIHSVYANKSTGIFLQNFLQIFVILVPT